MSQSMGICGAVICSYLFLWSTTEGYENAQCPIVVEGISRHSFEGFSIYHAVSRELIQERLDAFFESSDGGSDRPRLYLPEKTVFQDLIREDQHVIHLSVGLQVRSLNFDDVPEYPTVFVHIPLLTDDPERPPRYSLALGLLYPRMISTVWVPYIGFPYFPVDNINVGDDWVAVINGSDVVEFTFVLQDGPPTSNEELTDFFKAHPYLGTSKPNFEGCDSVASGNEYCSRVKGIRCAVTDAAPNFCQTAFKSDPGTWSAKNVRVGVHSGNATNSLRDFMAIGEGGVDIIDQLYLSTVSSVGVRFPCI